MDNRHTKVEGIRLTITGMDCADCARTIEKGVQAKAGVSRAQVDFVNGILTVYGDDLSEIELEKTVRSLGYGAEVAPVSGNASPQDNQQAKSLRRAVPLWKLWSVVLATLMVLSGGLSQHFMASSDIWRPLLLAGMILAGWQIAYKGVFAVRRLRLDMNFLMSAATIGAAIIGQWLEAGSVIVLFSFAQLLELYSMQRSRNAIRGLMNLSPKSATIISGNKEYQVPLDEIKIGDIVLVRPGERMPVDGRVTTGFSFVDEAAITGESLPVEKEPGNFVYAGTINGDSALEMETTHAPGDTTLDKIIHLVEQAQAQRAPSQSFVDKFSTYYTPIVVSLAVVLAITPPLLFGGIWNVWIYRSLVLLVIACPCALVISTPITVVSALANAARNGVLIKGGVFLENLHRVKAFAFDKTGTITTVKTMVHDVIALNSVRPDEIIRLAASVEARSEHPIAKAILHYARSRGIEIKPSNDFRALRGQGAAGVIDGQEIFLGNHSLFTSMNLASDEVNNYQSKIENESRTTILVGTSEMILGIIILFDEIREDAKSMIRDLRNEGISHVALLTGDNRFAGDFIGKAAGFDDVRAELLPQEKVNFIKSLRYKYANVAMVGDGVNDAPALAAANIGIAMGVAGSDAALESADIALMADELKKIPWTVRLSRRTYNIIMQNIILSIGIKAVFVVLAAAGLATLWMAVFADMGVSLMVIFNGMRALRQT